jgi:hypothetical protein
MNGPFNLLAESGIVADVDLLFRIVSDVKVFLVAIGFLILVSATIGHIDVRGVRVTIRPYQRVLLGLIGGAALLLAVLAYVQRPPATPALPKAAVVMWWGEKDTWPANFELCDGKYSKDLGADKPDFTDRFARGASETVSQVSRLSSGGNDSVPLPEHEHLLPELAAGWGPRVQPQDTRVFQQVLSSRNEHGGIARGFSSVWNSDDKAEGINPAAEFRPTAVYSLNAGQGMSISTSSMSNATIPIVPRFQQSFYIVKVRE